MVVEGREIKWMGAGGVKMKDSFGKMEGGEVLVEKMEMRG